MKTGKQINSQTFDQLFYSIANTVSK